MQLIPIKCDLIKPSADLVGAFLEALAKSDEKLEPADIIAVSSKVFSYAENRFADVTNFDELVKKEAELVRPSAYVYLTRKFGWWVANSGIDKSNVPEGQIILWPIDPQRSVDEFKSKIQGNDSLGVLMVDSFCTPGRRGVVGGAIACSGFEAVRDERGAKDLYGNPLQITTVAVADSLANAANFLMGEAAESTPFVIIRGADTKFVNENYDSIEMMSMNLDECLFNSMYK